VGDLDVLIDVLRLWGFWGSSCFLALFLVYAMVDRSVARMRWIDRSKMSLQELKDELKSNEGNPDIKGVRNQLHEEILRGAALSSVRGASVVITN